MPTHELILQSAAAARIISQLSQPRSCPLNIYTIPLILSNYQLYKCQQSTWSSRQINDLQLATSIQLLLGTNTNTHKKNHSNKLFYFCVTLELELGQLHICSLEDISSVHTSRYVSMCHVIPSL